ncbi:hypothetical protein ABZY19_33695 [Streptomyces sp. NPDC006475]|uniref:hypothetical protein n=1 Tax=Streptomyces sp. NPDC006475 TaxID=3155719 RepID=UPI0033B2ADAE
MRLNLPVQATIERRWDLYVPYLEVIATYEYENGETGEVVVGHQVGEPPPAFNLGMDVGDPGPWEGRDSRGWDCSSDGACVWNGVV